MSAAAGKRAFDFRAATASASKQEVTKKSKQDGPRRLTPPQARGSCATSPNPRYPLPPAHPEQPPHLHVFRPPAPRPATNAAASNAALALSSYLPPAQGASAPLRMAPVTSITCDPHRRAGGQAEPVRD